MCDLKSENEKLKKENGQLKQIVEQLISINKFLQLGNEGRRVSELENAKLKGELIRAEFELAKYRGVQEVIDIHATNDTDAYVVMWTDREGQKRKIELKLVKNPMDETTGREMDIYELTRT